MKLLIILTKPFYKLLQDPKDWQHDPACESWVLDVGNDRICIVSQCGSPDYAEDDEDRRAKIRNATTVRLAEIINQLPVEQIVLYLAFHKNCVDPAALKADTQREIASLASFIHEREFSTEYVYPKLWSLVQSPTTDNFEAAISAVMKKQGELRAERVAALSYQLMRHFAAIELDLSNWGSLKLDEEGRTQIAAAYAKAAERLVQARPTMYGGDAYQDENLERIMIESGLTQHESWRTVQGLLPRERSHDSVTSLFDDAFQLYSRVASLAGDKQASELKRMIGPGNVLKKWCEAVNAALTELKHEVTVANAKHAALEVVSEIPKESSTDARISHH
jgi:hypothetical protein